MEHLVWLAIALLQLNLIWMLRQMSRRMQRLERSIHHSSPDKERP